MADGIHDEMVYEDEEEGDEIEDDESDLSSSPSIPDENIDFDLVYALHNFVATVEGQATVHKGNSLTLLDDSNSYWWLVRVLRTQESATSPPRTSNPFRAPRRLNKHRTSTLPQPPRTITYKSQKRSSPAISSKPGMPLVPLSSLTTQASSLPSRDVHREHPPRSPRTKSATSEVLSLVPQPILSTARRVLRL